MEASSSENSERIPTYEESIQGDPPEAAKLATKSEPPTASSSRQPLPQLLSRVRSERIDSIITTYIDPLIESQVLSGLSKTTVALVPSNSDSLQTTGTSRADIIEGSGDSISRDSVEAVIGFPDEDYVKLVRLHGEEYNMHFWRQPAVIKELEASLKSRLAANGHKLEGLHDQHEVEESPSAPVSPTPIPPKSKFGFFSKKVTEIPIQPPLLKKVSKNLQGGYIRLAVGLDDVSLRVVTDMGLYDTRVGKALLIKFEIGV